MPPPSAQIVSANNRKEFDEVAKWHFRYAENSRETKNVFGQLNQPIRADPLRSLRRSYSAFEPIAPRHTAPSPTSAVVTAPAQPEEERRDHASVEEGESGHHRRFDFIEANKEKYREQFLTAKPFPHIAIDGLCDEAKLTELYNSIPEIETASADYVFAKNKFEKSKFKELGGVFEELYNDLISVRFKTWISYITNEDVFIDDTFYGGGIHQGREGSFLDMHADFNYHPLVENWYRNLNLLLYINKDWQESYGGHLRLEDERTGVKTEVGVPFNRLAIMHCRSYTLHGYDPINFPKGTARTSIAAYAYTVHENNFEAPRTTVWHVKKDNPIKYALSKIWVPAVKLKSMFFKSDTAKH